MTTLYTLKPLTNLHVGSGDINFDIIDNQVQKDATTQLPVIHSSSLKGALREHCSEKLEPKLLNYIFGSEEKESGNYSFFEAKMFSRPVRSNVEAYFHATSPSLIKEFLVLCDTLQIVLDEALKQALETLSNTPVQPKQPVAFSTKQGIILEDFEATSSQKQPEEILKEFFGEHIAVFHEDDLKTLDLPVLARNKLNNGTSKNLWYEEVVPAQTQFYFCFVHNKEVEEFEQILCEDIIQVGANKSIGYGFSKLTKVSK
jgi:CRISPR-associated protein Cmr4